MLSDSDGSDSDMDIGETVQDPGPDVKGLALAEHYFGPLLSPVPATPVQWTAYAKLRLDTNTKHKNVFSRRKRSISDCVAVIERDLVFDQGTLQKCISIINRWVEWDDESPRNSDIAYYCRSRSSSVEWFYSIGYKIGRRVSSKTPYSGPSNSDLIEHCHSRAGWQAICWAYFDDSDGNYGPKWKRIEKAGMGLYQEGVLDIYETLFGPIETPPHDDKEAVLAYRRKLVACVRLLLAAVGINYQVACTDEERDRPSREYTLEGLSDDWVARGIRKACGFQLSGDADAEKRGREERERYANESDDGDDSEDYDF